MFSESSKFSGYSSRGYNYTEIYAVFLKENRTCVLVYGFLLLIYVPYVHLNIRNMYLPTLYR